MLTLRFYLAVMILIALFCGVISAENGSSTQGDIIFSHDLHVGDMEIECGTCHGSISNSNSATDRNLPEMDVCGDCHDIEDDEACGTCHRNADDPGVATHFVALFLFNHAAHIDAKVECTACHRDLSQLVFASNSRIQNKTFCLTCHDGNRQSNVCEQCHSAYKTGKDYHPIDWRHNHGDAAHLEPEWCGTCHKGDTDCLACHRGDNIVGTIHELNYHYTHGLDARTGTMNCATCHDREQFCNDCHLRELRMPLNHSTAVWRNEHGMMARMETETCASCHDADNATCLRCHSDADGIRGTDFRYHGTGSTFFDSKGLWHGDDGYMCFQCHTNTGAAGVGFCGYCHN
ncbi:MAG: cytochrome c3 family protein [Candidatus Zixiibacteriota bacterium]